jgi:hypothetical protein
MNSDVVFQVGDRISTKYPLVGLPAGSCGTVQLVFVSVPGVYEVLFEFDRMLHISYQADLTLIPSARQIVGI